MSRLNCRQSRTCITAIKTKRGKLVMAGDRRASWDWSQAHNCTQAKVMKRDGVLIGATGDSALCKLFVEVMDIPTIDVTDTDTYMYYKFQQALVRTLKQQVGYADTHKNLCIPSDVSCQLLVAVLGRLYTIEISNPDPDKERSGGLISIDDAPIPFAIGCGALASLGVLHGKLMEHGQLTKEDLILSLQVACELSPGCALINNHPDIVSE